MTPQARYIVDSQRNIIRCQMNVREAERAAELAEQQWKFTQAQNEDNVTRANLDLDTAQAALEEANDAQSGTDRAVT